jgi:hypothetical protein
VLTLDEWTVSRPALLLFPFPSPPVVEALELNGSFTFPSARERTRHRRPEDPAKGDPGALQRSDRQGLLVTRPVPFSFPFFFFPFGSYLRLGSISHLPSYNTPVFDLDTDTASMLLLSISPYDPFSFSATPT